MRVRHLGPFPFRWANQGANAAAWEPFTFTLKQAMEYWWRVRTLSVTVSATCTSTWSGTDTRTVSKTWTATRYSAEKGASMAAGDELYLCFPGCDEATITETADFQGNTAGVVPGGLWFDNVTPAGQSYEFIAAVDMFTQGDGASRGVWADINTVQPACDLSFSLRFYDPGSISNGPTCTVSNIAPAAGSAGSGTFTLAVFGQNVDFFWEGNDNDYGGIFTWDDVDVTAITKTAWFPYEVDGGGTPVWDSATGAQILDPREASVP